jgi:hypothetical protein
VAEGRLYDVAAHLLDCVCAKLGSRCPGRRCVVPGLEPSFENCCEGDRGGQLTVHAVQRFPSRSFPTADLGRPNNCDVPWIVAAYTVTIIRCMPAGSAHRAPTCDQLDEVAQRTLKDMEQVWDGLVCCLQDEEAMQTLLTTTYTWTMGTQQTITPGGGCVGSTTQVILGMPPCLEC